MRQIIAFYLTFISTWTIAQPDFSKVSAAVDSTYGYTDTNPLKLRKGNPGRSIGYAYDFLNSLVTPDGRNLQFVQRFSVENPDSDKLEAKLDKYIFLTHQEKDTVTIYVDIHHKGDLRIPMGLKCKYD